MSWVRRTLDELDEHKEDIVALLYTVGVLVGMLTLPASGRVAVLTSPAFAALIAGTGFGLGVSRVGRGLRDKLQSDASSSNTPTQNGETDD